MNDRIGTLLPWESDIRAEAVLRPGTFVTRLHDSRPRARDDHEARFGNLSAKLSGALILGTIRRGPRRTENTDLPFICVGGKKFVAVTQLLEGGLQKSYVPPRFNIF